LKECINGDKFITEKLISFKENLFKPQADFTSHWLHKLFFEESKPIKLNKMIKNHEEHKKEYEEIKKDYEKNHKELESIQFQIKDNNIKDENSRQNAYHESLIQNETNLKRKEAKLANDMKQLVNAYEYPKNLLKIIDTFSTEMKEIEESKRKDYIIQSIDKRLLLIQNNPDDFINKIEVLKQYLLLLSKEKSEEKQNDKNVTRVMIINTLHEKVRQYQNEKLKKETMENKSPPVQFEKIKQQFEQIKQQLINKKWK